MYTQLVYYFLSTYKLYDTIMIIITIPSYHHELHKNYQLMQFVIHFNNNNYYY